MTEPEVVGFDCGKGHLRNTELNDDLDVGIRQTIPKLVIVLKLLLGDNADRQISLQIALRHSFLESYGNQFRLDHPSLTQRHQGGHLLNWTVLQPNMPPRYRR